MRRLTRAQRHLASSSGRRSILLCVSIRWRSRFEDICDFVSSCPLRFAQSSEATKQPRKSSIYLIVAEYRHVVRGEAKRSSDRSSPVSVQGYPCLSYRENEESFTMRPILCLTSRVFRFRTGPEKARLIVSLNTAFGSAATHSTRYSQRGVSF